MRADEIMLHNISIGYAIEWENRVLMASIKERRIPSAFYSIG